MKMGGKMSKVREIIAAHKKVAYKEDLGSEQLLDKYRPKEVTSTDNINFGEKVCSFPVPLAGEDVERALRRRAATTVNEAYQLVVAYIGDVTPEWEKELKEYLKTTYGFNVTV